MDLKNLRVDELTQNLWKNRENPQMKPDIWFHFLNLFFNKPIIEKFEASDDLLIGNVSILGKINELIILFIQEDNNLRSVIKACNELSKKVITSKFKDCQLLALNPCNSGLKILFFSSFVNGSINRVKLIHFQQGRVPRYFQELIESDDNTNPILSLQRLIDASSMKMSLMNYINRAFTHLSKDKIIAFLALLLYYSIFIPYNDFSDWLQTKSKDSDEFTLMYYLSELHEYMNQKHIENLESIEIDSILQEFDNILIDSGLFQDILYSFPFTLTEPTAFFQEIAINPTILSDLAEELAISSSKKKEGKYYTSESNADFISNIAVFRMLSNKLTGMEANDLYKWVYQDWGFEFEPFVFSLDQLSTTHSCLKILDPACGSGTFLLSVTRLLSRLAISLVSSCEKFFPIVELIGIDPDKIALLVTRLRLNFFKLQELTDILSSDPTGRTDSPFRLDFRYIQGDFLVHPKIYDQKYDLILGNPPWIRHEDIGASHAPGYKNLIRTQIKKFSGENTFFDWKSDLYVYFSLMALSLLEDGGILAFLTSNAWLEVKYGRTLQKYILDPINGIYMFEIIHRRGRRLWDQLGINSVIFIGQKALSKNATIPKGTFTEFLVDFSQVPLSSLRNCIMFQNTYEDQYYRIELIQRDLLKQTHKWGGTFLRTSGSERVLLKRFKNRGLPLSLLADVRFGIKTGANDFFHIRCIEDKPRSDGKTYIKNRMGYEGLVENIYLVPLVKSPADIKGFVIPSSFTSNLYLFYCLDSPNELQGSEALKYIKWAEKVNVVVKQGKASGSKVQGFSSLRSVKQREYWYSIGEYPPPSLLWTKSYHDRPGCLYNQAKMFPDQRLYGINVTKKEHLPLIFTYLNSSLVWAQMEAEGNTNMGFGVLDTNVYFLREIKIPIDAMEEKNQILRLMNELINQEERVSMLQFSPVRSEIDQFYAKYFNLSHNSMERLYGYISRSIHNRIR